jgi:hypothetical protein
MIRWSGVLGRVQYCVKLLVGHLFLWVTSDTVGQRWLNQRIGRRLMLPMHVRTSVGTWVLIGNLRVS